VDKQDEEKMEAEMEEELMRNTEKVNDVTEKIQEQQDRLIKQLTGWYHEGGNPAILSAIEDAKGEETDEFEFIELSEWSGEDFKEFEKKSKEQQNMGLSQYGILDSNFIYTSNYFGLGGSSTTNPTKQSAEKKVEDNEEKKEELIGAESRPSIKNQISAALSSSGTLSSDEDEDYEEMATFYFLDSRRAKVKHILSNSEFDSTSKSRRYSMEGNELQANNFFLQASVAPKKLNVINFSHLKWKEIHSFIIHNTMICRTLAKILMLCLPHIINEDATVMDNGRTFSLKPANDESKHMENMHAYKLVKLNVEFLYRNIKKMTRITRSGEMLELVSKILNTV
jgi:hypothetical protein